LRNTPSLFKAHAAMFFVALLYGINYFTLKEVFNEGYNNFALLTLRTIVTASFFFLFHTLAIREKIQSRKDYLRLLLCAFFGISLNQTFFLWGVASTSKVNAAVLMVTSPVFVFLAAWVLKQEIINLHKILGLLLSMSGAIALILSNNGSEAAKSGATIQGDLMIMVNAASYGLYLVLVRPLMQKYNPFTIVKWVFLFGLIPNTAIGIVPLMQSDFGSISGKALFGIFFLIFFATITVYFLNGWAMKRVPSSAVGAYVYLQPVFVTLFSAFLSHGEVTWMKIQFILLIFAGVYLVSAKQSAKRPGKQREES
jgi:drug/metabolite transporter (DMT)-like permease